MKRESTPCANCKLRARYDRNPKSISGRFWHWHIGYCPGFKKYYQSLDEASQKSIREQYGYLQPKKQRFLTLCACLNILLSIGHLLCLLCLSQAFQLYGIQKMMDSIAAIHPLLPHAITVAIAIAFAIAGICGLSKAGVVRKLPLTHLVVALVAFTFTARAVWGIVGLFHQFSWLSVSSIFIALFIGLGYFHGLRR